MQKLPTFIYHYFLDEAGDATFYGKGRVPILGQDGVSSCFILGLLKINEPLNAIREKIRPHCIEYCRANKVYHL